MRFFDVFLLLYRRGCVAERVAVISAKNHANAANANP